MIKLIIQTNLMPKQLYLIIIFFFYTTLSFSKSFTLTAIVYDGTSKEPLIGATIRDNGSDKSCLSNSMGFFSLRLDSGACTISISYIGYKTYQEKLNVSKNIQLNFYLQKESYFLDTITLSAKLYSEINNVQSGKIELPIHQIQAIPSILGESDPLKIAQMLPGIQSGGEATPGLFVRGSAADQNLVLIDDAPVYNPFHLFGIFSVVNSDALKTFEITKGGYSSEYGGRLASVVNMNLKEGNKNKLVGDLSLGLASSKVLIELPLVKNKVSMIVSGRSSYAHLLVKQFLPKDQYGSYYFHDFSTKVSAELSPKTKLFFSAMYSGDVFSLTDESLSYSLYYARVKWKNTTSSLRWNHIINSKLFWNATAIYSSYNLISNVDQKNTNVAYYLKYQTSIRDLALKNDFTYYLNANHQFKFGSIVTQKKFIPDVVSSKDEEISSLNRTIGEYITIESAIYVDDEFKLGKRILGRIGGRLNIYTYNNQTILNPEPRVSLAYWFMKTCALKGTYTKMHQYLHLLTTKGVGLPSDLWVPATDKVPYKSANQYTIALVKDLHKSTSISLECYYKKISNDISLREGSSFMYNKNLDFVDNSDLEWENNVTTGTSWNYGSELFIHKKRGRLQGWIGYTLAWSQSKFAELNFGKAFFSRQDRRHSLSVMTIFQINEGWSLSASWVYMTGNAITLANSIYSNVDIPSNLLYIPSASTPVNYEYSGINNFRMPAYHRFDLGVSFKKQRNNIFTELELSVYNVYNRQNAYFYYVLSSNDSSGIKNNNTVKQISVLPVIPSINYKIRF